MTEDEKNIITIGFVDAEERRNEILLFNKGESIFVQHDVYESEGKRFKIQQRKSWDEAFNRAREIMDLVR